MSGGFHTLRWRRQVAGSTASGQTATAVVPVEELEDRLQHRSDVAQVVIPAAVEVLLKEAQPKGLPAWREQDQAAQHGRIYPILYQVLTGATLPLADVTLATQALARSKTPSLMDAMERIDRDVADALSEGKDAALLAAHYRSVNATQWSLIVKTALIDYYCSTAKSAHWPPTVGALEVCLQWYACVQRSCSEQPFMYAASRVVALLMELRNRSSEGHVHQQMIAQALTKAGLHGEVEQIVWQVNQTLQALPIDRLGKSEEDRIQMWLKNPQFAPITLEKAVMRTLAMLQQHTRSRLQVWHSLTSPDRHNMISRSLAHSLRSWFFNLLSPVSSPRSGQIKRLSPKALASLGPEMAWVESEVPRRLQTTLDAELLRSVWGDAAESVRAKCRAFVKVQILNHYRDQTADWLVGLSPYGQEREVLLRWYAAIAEHAGLPLAYSPFQVKGLLLQLHRNPTDPRVAIFYEKIRDSFDQFPLWSNVTQVLIEECSTCLEQGSSESVRLQTLFDKLASTKKVLVLQQRIVARVVHAYLSGGIGRVWRDCEAGLQKSYFLRALYCELVLSANPGQALQLTHAPLIGLDQGETWWRWLDKEHQNPDAQAHFAKALQPLLGSVEGLWQGFQQSIELAMATWRSAQRLGQWRFDDKVTEREIFNRFFADMLTTDAKRMAWNQLSPQRQDEIIVAYCYHRAMLKQRVAPGQEKDWLYYPECKKAEWPMQLLTDTTIALKALIEEHDRQASAHPKPGRRAPEPLQLVISKLRQWVGVAGLPVSMHTEAKAQVGHPVVFSPLGDSTILGNVLSDETLQRQCVENAAACLLERCLRSRGPLAWHGLPDIDKEKYAAFYLYQAVVNTSAGSELAYRPYLVRFEHQLHQLEWVRHGNELATVHSSILDCRTVEGGQLIAAVIHQVDTVLQKPAEWADAEILTAVLADVQWSTPILTQAISALAVRMLRQGIHQQRWQEMDVATQQNLLRQECYLQAVLSSHPLAQHLSYYPLIHAYSGIDEQRRALLATEARREGVEHTLASVTAIKGWIERLPRLMSEAQGRHCVQLALKHFSDEVKLRLQQGVGRFDAGLSASARTMLAKAAVYHACLQVCASRGFEIAAASFAQNIIADNRWILLLVAEPEMYGEAVVQLNGIMQGVDSAAVLREALGGAVHRPLPPLVLKSPSSRVSTPDSTRSRGGVSYEPIDTANCPLLSPEAKALSSTRGQRRFFAETPRSHLPTPAAAGGHASLFFPASPAAGGVSTPLAHQGSTLFKAAMEDTKLDVSGDCSQSATGGQS